MHRDRERADRQAVAIVGAACRLPGGINGLDELWNALEQGRDLIGSVPEDRFETSRFVDPSMPRVGKSYTAVGGFLDDVAGFDAAYFGVSPKEAAQVDPQHRLLMELAAEALDDAAVAPETLAGSDTAVYVGISDMSYGTLQLLSPRTVNAYTMSGSASSIAANRLSYTFDLRGPSMAVDTACSSSLVALDQACRSLWSGTSRVALCGGVNVLLSPFHYVGFSQASMLSARGRCASFSAQADGFVRAEGGVVVLLKRLDDALADGDRLHGVILGSATNCDGRTMGLALPNPQAQEELLRRIYAEAGVDPDELVYFEAHGTGTPVGDPLEARAIGRALGIRRITGDLGIGSVKSNLGHLEPASGLAGLCKALLVLKHRAVPATLHCEQPHPDVDFAGLGLRIEVRNRALPTDGRLVVGVNSFGFGGANAHTVLASAPPVLPPGASTAPPEGLPVLVSARTEPALAEAVRRMTARLASAAPREFYDIAYTSCRRRGKHEHRAVVLAHSTGDAERGFTALATTDEASTSLQQKADGVTHSGGAAAVGGWERGAGAPAAGASAKAVERGRVVFVFCGNGSQWAGMGTDLLAGDSIFRETVNRVDAALAPLLGWSAAEALAAPPEQWCLDLTERAQPLLFTLQVALAAVLRERGIEPAMVLGHSVGEVAAAHCAGALTLAQAALVIAERSRLQGATRGGGRMAAVGLSAERAAERLSSFGGRLEIAGVNSPQDVTIAGDPQALADLGRQLTGQAVFFRELDLDYAFHSSSMDSLAEPLGAALAALAPSPAAVALHSTVTGARAGGTDLDAAYWWQNVRRPVRFSAAVEQALDDGGDILLEIGPHPVLQTYLRRIAATRPRTTVTVLGTLRRDGDGATQLATTHAALLAAGADIDWGRYFPRPGQVTGLPAYPWQRERHWEGTRESWISSSGDGVLRHPLLGERLPAPLPVWQGPIEPVLLPWLGDHRVAGSVVMPATGFVEMALAAGRAVCAGPVEVEHLDLSHALVIPWADPSSVRVQLSLSPDDGTVSITSTNHGPGRAADAARPHARTPARGFAPCCGTAPNPLISTRYGNAAHG